MYPVVRNLGRCDELQIRLSRAVSRSPGDLLASQSINAAKCPHVVNGSLTGSEHHRSRSEGTLRRHRSNHGASSPRRDRAPASSARPSPIPHRVRDRTTTPSSPRGYGSWRRQAAGSAPASEQQRRHHRQPSTRITSSRPTTTATACEGTGWRHGATLFAISRASRDRREATCGQPSHRHRPASFQAGGRYFGGCGGLGIAESIRIFHAPPSRTSTAVQMPPASIGAPL